ncbi:MAG: DNA-primase RepB domain-containing protein [Candidatus Thiodiazotropha sp.]
MNTAIEHTELQFDWFDAAGVRLYDMAVRRKSGEWLWHKAITEDTLFQYMPWVRSENAKKSDIYIRPARNCAWPILFFDDVPLERVEASLERNIPLLAIQTSEEGGHHVWIACDRDLDETERGYWQREWRDALQADPGSVSGEHLGRLAGVKNWKRSGTWVNVVEATVGERLDIPAMPSSSLPPASTWQANDKEGGRVVRSSSGTDDSKSGEDWGYACSALAHGAAEETVAAELEGRALRRGKRNPAYYARTTVRKAKSHIQW